MSGQIKYNYGGIDALLQQAHSEQGQLVSLTSEMDGIRNQCSTLWEDPESAAAFQQVYQKWVSGSNEVQEILASIIRAAGSGNSDMQSTNSKIAGGW